MLLLLDIAKQTRSSIPPISLHSWGNNFTGSLSLPVYNSKCSFRPKALLDRLLRSIFVISFFATLHHFAVSSSILLKVCSQCHTRYDSFQTLYTVIDSSLWKRFPTPFLYIPYSLVVFPRLALKSSQILPFVSVLLALSALLKDSRCREKLF